VSAAPPSLPRRRGRTQQRVTARDVAERAGVATMTVSRVLNQPEAVSEKLRTRVLDAIQALGYVPNRFAGGLASQRASMSRISATSRTVSGFTRLPL